MRRPTFLRFLGRPRVLVGRKIKLRSKYFEDTLNDYRWRRDEELCRLDAAPLMQISLEDYQKLIVEQPIHPTGSCQFAIVTMEGKHIGNCSYFNIDSVNHQAEIGIMIGEKEYWGKGCATEAIRLISNYAFITLNLHKLTAGCYRANAASSKAFEKAGFIEEGMRKAHMFYDGTYQDIFQYAMINSGEQI